MSPDYFLIFIKKCNVAVIESVDYEVAAKDLKMYCSNEGRAEDD